MVYLLDALYQEISITNICILYFTNFSWFVADPIYSRDYVLKDRDHWSIAKIAYIPDCSSLFHYVSVKLFFIFFWGLRWKSLKMLEIMCLCWTWVVLHTGGLWAPREACWIIKSPLTSMQQGVALSQKVKAILDLESQGQWSNGKITFIFWNSVEYYGVCFLFGFFCFVFVLKGLNNVT